VFDLSDHASIRHLASRGSRMRVTDQEPAAASQTRCDGKAVRAL